MKTKAVHPTKQRLLDTVVEILYAREGARPTVDEVLEQAKVSRGSLYHHFGDFDHLIEDAQISQFSRFVDVTASRMGDLLETVKTPTELKDALFAITVATQSDQGAKSRLLRSRLIGESEYNPQFKAKLQLEVDRLTETLESLIQAAMDRSWFKPTYPARVIAVFIQAYTLGKVLNDLSLNKVAEDDWNKLINDIIESFFINI